MASTSERPETRIYFTQPLPRDSHFYDAYSPDFWRNKIELAHFLDALLQLPLRDGTMSEKDVLKVHNFLIMLAYGKNNVPFIAYLEANQTRTNLVSVGLLRDKYTHSDPSEQAEVIDRPQLLRLQANPVDTALQLRTTMRTILNRDTTITTPGGGFTVSHRDPSDAHIPGVIAIAGTSDSGLAVGRLLRSNYEPLLMSQATSALRSR